MSQPESKIPEVTFEEMLPEDIPSGLRTLSNPHWRRVILEPRGCGYEKYLQWAREEIKAASDTPDVHERDRQSVNAVMHARRALSCLIDQYLMRDGFVDCCDAPADTESKTELLVSRGILDTLAAGALRRSINTRHDVEHRYTHLDLADAQDVVHNILTTVENTTARSSPYHAHACLGYALGGTSDGKKGPQAWFNGWSGPILVFATTLSPPWLGIVVPNTDTVAVVRKVNLSQLTCNQLEEALKIAESIGGEGYSGYGVETWHLILQSWGLIE